MTTTTFAYTVSRLIGFYQGTIFVYVILSWFSQDPASPVAGLHRALAVVCEPFVGLFRRILPPMVVGGAGLDLSPLVAMLALSVLQRLVVTLA